MHTVDFIMICSASLFKNFASTACQQIYKSNELSPDCCITCLTVNAPRNNSCPIRQVVNCSVKSMEKRTDQK